MKNRNKPIIIGTPFGYNTIGIMRSLGEANIDFHLILIGGKSRLETWSVYCKDYKVLDYDELSDYLLKYSIDKAKDYKPVIISCGDMITEYLDKNMNLFQDKFILPLSSKQGKTTFYMNKKNMKDLAGEVGLPVLPSCTISRSDKKSLTNQFIQFPCITKSISSNKGGKGDMFICHNIEDLQNALENTQSDELLVEKLVEKETEFSIFGLALNTQFVFIGSRFFNCYTEKNFGGTSFSFNEEELNKYIPIIKLKEFIGRIEYNGLFGIEFLVTKNNEFFFMEVNLRNDGYSYEATASGGNFPAMWALQKIDVNYFTKSVCCMNEPLDFYQEVRLSKRMTLFKWLKHWWSCDTYLFANKKDKLSTLGFVLDLIEKKIKRK